MIATDRLFRDLVGGHAAVVAERLPFGHGDLDGDEMMGARHRFVSVLMSSMRSSIPVIVRRTSMQVWRGSCVISRSEGNARRIV